MSLVHGFRTVLVTSGGGEELTQLLNTSHKKAAIFSVAAGFTEVSPRYQREQVPGSSNQCAVLGVKSSAKGEMSKDDEHKMPLFGIWFHLEQIYSRRECLVSSRFAHPFCSFLTPQ
jgi:hypothetical protein